MEAMPRVDHMKEVFEEEMAELDGATMGAPLEGLMNLGRGHGPPGGGGGKDDRGAAPAILTKTVGEKGEGRGAATGGKLPWPRLQVVGIVDAGVGRVAGARILGYLVSTWYQGVKVMVEIKNPRFVTSSF